MLARFPVWLSKRIPQSVKQAVHRVRLLDNALMYLYGSLVKGRIVSIAEGPMSGLQLATSRHTSHAHLLGTYEREVQDAIDSMVRRGDIRYDLGASIG